MICFVYVMICIEEKRKLETINKICQKTIKTNKLVIFYDEKVFCAEAQVEAVKAFDAQKTYSRMKYKQYLFYNCFQEQNFKIQMFNCFRNSRKNKWI
jgi:hypothetical protein